MIKTNTKQCERGKRMKDYFSFVKIVGIMIFAYVIELLGGWDNFLEFYLFIMAVDFTTGTIKAMYLKNFSSTEIYRGIIKKIFSLIVIAISVKLDAFFNIDVPLRNATITFFSYHESISVIENIEYFIPIPPKMKEFFEQMKKENEDHDN